MAASLGDPYTLAAYPVSQYTTGDVDHVFTYPPMGHEKDFSATIGVQGDGIHIIDLTTLQDDASLIAGPATTFAASPVSRIDDSSETPSKRFTYAVINATTGLDKSAQRQTIWSFTSQGSLGSLEKQHEVTLPQVVSHIHAPHWMPSAVLAVSETGTTTLLDKELNIKQTETGFTSSGKIVGSFIFRAREASFLSASTRAGCSNSSCLVVNVSFDKSTIVVSLILVDGDLKALGKASFPSDKSITSITCNADGTLTIIDQLCKWTTLQLEHANEQFIIREFQQPLVLSSLSSSQSAILALTSSHALFATVKLQEVVLLLWDVQYSVVLTERRHPLPSYLATVASDKLHLSLTRASSSLALLCVCPSFSAAERQKKATVGVKSLVLSVPYDVPATSSLKNALGKTALTQKWLATSLEETKFDGVDGAAAGMLKNLAKEIDTGRTEEANEVFFKWIEKEQRIDRAEWDVNSTTVGTHGEDSDVEMSDGAQPKKNRKGSKKHKAYISHALVSNSLAIILGAGKADVSYPSKIVHYLLERKLVHDSMVEGGIVSALQARHDWRGIELVITNANDIPETALVTLLKECIDKRVVTTSSHEATVDVDPPKISTPRHQAFSVEHMLALLVRYPVSGPPLRVAFKEVIPKAEDITIVLEVLAGWIESWSEKGAMIRTDRDIGEKELLKRASKSAKNMGKEGGLPRLDLIASFLNHLLDASLVSLLQYRPAHDILTQLTGDLKPQLSLLEELDTLRGPLEPFVRAQARSLKGAMELDAKQAQKVAYQAAELQIGLYQIEEVFI